MHPTMDESFSESSLLDSVDKQDLRSLQLTSSITSSSSLRRASSRISKTYKQASTLFLTRRLSESLSTLTPLITVPNLPEDGVSEDGISEPAPIAKASRSSRIKVWSLYLTLLNSIIELGPEDGKEQLGGELWRGIVSKARDGTIWEEVVQIGYGGVEGDVDAEVVSNLATLLLAQSPSQKTNQHRLETFLSTSPSATLDVTNQPDPPNENDDNRHRNKEQTNNPRDLESRIKILELYAIHVLPRNDEWDYARELILLSDILDEESREVSLRNLASLQEEKASHHNREHNLQRERDPDLEQEHQHPDPKKLDPSPTQHKQSQPSLPVPNHHRKLNSEKDYGIETPLPSKTSSFSSSPSSKKTKQPPTKGIYQQSLSLLRALISNMRHSISQNPLSIFRFVLFLLGLVIALSRRGVRERLRRLTGEGWEKMRRTLGMGVRVSYI